MTVEHLVDGVPVLLAPPGDGPCAGGIWFRVGMVDEPPRLRGVSHLIEHLALSPLAGSTAHYNGETGAELTGFHLQGSVGQVADFLTAVCVGLSDLPTAGLEREKSVLRTEEAARPSVLSSSLALRRFGTRGPGRAALPEWGVPGLQAEDLYGWSRYFFTGGNAVCWLIADEVPAGLRLPLAEGPRRPVPPARPVLTRTPAYYPGGHGLVGWSATTDRSAASAVLAGVVQRDLFRSLRTEAGLSYDVSASLLPRGPDDADLVVAADALQEKEDAVLGTVLRALTRLKLGRLGAEDFGPVRTEALEQLRRADAERSLLPGDAADLALGRSPATLDERRGHLEALDWSEVVAVGRAAFATGLLRVPAGLRAEQAGFTAATLGAVAPVTGRTFPGHDGPGGADGTIVVGPAGVSRTVATWSGTESVTIPYADCEVLLVYPDGGRRLVGADGAVVNVEPTLHPGLSTMVPEIDAAVLPGSRIPVARTPADVPQPQPGGASRRPVSPATGVETFRRRLGTVLLVLGWAVAALLLFSGLVVLGDDRVDAETTLVVGAVLALVLAGLTVRRRISRRRSVR